MSPFADVYVSSESHGIWQGFLDGRMNLVQSRCTVKAATPGFENILFLLSFLVIHYEDSVVRMQYHDEVTWISPCHILVSYIL